MGLPVIRGPEHKPPEALPPGTMSVEDWQKTLPPGEDKRGFFGKTGAALGVGLTQFAANKALGVSTIPGVPDKALGDFAKWAQDLVDPDTVQMVNEITGGQMKLDSAWEVVKQLPKIGWYGLLQNAPQLFDAIVANKIGEALGGAVGGIGGPKGRVVGKLLGGHVMGTASAALTEAGSFKDSALQTLKSQGIDETTANMLADKYARMYGPAAGVVEYASNIYQVGKATKGLNKAAIQTLKKTPIWKLLFDPLLGGTSEGLEEVTQAGLQQIAEGRMIDEAERITGRKLARPKSGGYVIQGIQGAAVGTMMGAMGLPSSIHAQHVQNKQIKARDAWAQDIIDEVYNQAGPTAAEVDLAASKPKEVVLGKPGPTLQPTYRGTTVEEWENIKSGGRTGTELSGETWVIPRREYAENWTKRAGEKGVLIEYKSEAREKLKRLTDDPGDDRLMGKLGLEDVARVFDANGNVIYDARRQTPGKPTVPQTFVNPRGMADPAARQRAEAQLNDYLLGQLTGYPGVDPAEAGRVIAALPIQERVRMGNLPAAEQDAAFRALANQAQAKGGGYDQARQGGLQGVKPQGPQPGGAVPKQRPGGAPAGPGGVVQAPGKAPVAGGAGGAAAGAVGARGAGSGERGAKEAKIRIPARSPANQTAIIQAPLDPSKEANGYYAWVDLDDPALQAARQNNAATAFQGRDRERQAYLGSQATRLQKFDPSWLGDSATSDRGSPMIDQATGLPVAGYGRLNTLEDVYNLPDTDPRKQGLIKYQNQVSASFGIGDRPADMKRPIIVRVLEDYSPNTDAEDFAIESNRTVAEQMSDAELAMLDARMITESKLLDALTVSESGELLSKDNTAFINAYLGKVQNAATLKNSDGSLNIDKVTTRLQRALLAVLMREDAGAMNSVTALTERAGEYGLKEAINGLAAAAPNLVRLKSIRPEFDLTPEISAAMPVLLEAKRALLAGETPDLATYFGQLDFYRQATEEQQAVVMVLAQIKSAKQLREVLREYAATAETHDPNTLDMFEGTIPAAKKIDLLRRIIKGENIDEYIKTRLITEGGGEGVPQGPGKIEGAEAGSPAEAAGPGAAAVDPAAERLRLAQEELDKLMGGEEPGEVKERTALYGEIEGGKSAFRQRLEAIAASKAGPARADIKNLAQREVQSKAGALVAALEAGRIDEAEAQRRFEDVESKALKALARDERERQKREPKAVAQDLYEDNRPASRGELFEEGAIYDFAEAEGVKDEKAAYRLSYDARQLDLPGMDQPYAKAVSPQLPKGKEAPGEVGRQTGEAEAQELQRYALTHPEDHDAMRRALKATKGRISNLVQALINREIPGFDVEGQTIETPRDFASLALTCRSRFFEIYKIAVADKQTGRIVYSKVVTVGVKDHAVIDPQGIIQAVQIASRESKIPADRLKVYAAHNHPGGDPTPSTVDTHARLALDEACGQAGIEVEHVNTNGETYYSYADHLIHQFPDYTPMPIDLMPPETMLSYKTPDKFEIVAESLRKANAKANYIIMLDGKNHIREIEQFEYNYNWTAEGKAIIKQLDLGMSRVHAASAFLVLPQNSDALVKALRASMELQAVHLLDVNSPTIPSWQTIGLIVREAPAGYGAAGPRQIEAAARVIVEFANREKLTITPELVQNFLEQKYGDKLKAYYGDIAKLAGEIQRNNENDLWFGMRTGKLGAEGEKGAQERAAAAAAPDARRGGRTDIRIAGGMSIPKPTDHIAPNAYDIDDDQRLGVNLQLERILVKKQKGFLCGDGTGVGKTSQILVTAHEYAKRTGKKVLIVTQNLQIIQGTYLDDAARLGFSLEDFDIGTYSSIRGGHGKRPMILRKVVRGQAPEKVEIGANDRYGLIILDEAHNLKNHAAKQTIQIRKMLQKADHNAFYTATPMDTPTGAAYFMSEITGIPADRIARMLGFEIVAKLDPRTGELKEHIKLIKGMSWKDVKKNLVNLRETAVAQGALIRREYPFLGKFENVDFELNAEDQALHDTIEEYFDAVLATIPPGDYHGKIKSHKLHSLSHWLESKKVAAAFEQIKASLAAGRRPVVVCQYVNPSNRLRRPEGNTRGKILQGQIWDKVLGRQPVIVGTIKELAKLMDAAGIKYSRIYGSGSKAAEVEKFQKDETQVALMTARSGGAGINADDSVGGRPRDLIRLTTEFAGDVDQQTIGRVNRRNTVNPELVRVIDVYAQGLFSEERRRAINQKKQEILKRIQEGEDIDLARFKAEESEVKPQEIEGEEEEDGGLADLMPGESGEGPLADKPIEALRDADIGGDPLAEEEDLADGADQGMLEIGQDYRQPAPALKPEDDPGYSVFPIELPEMVQIAKHLTGQYPVVRRGLPGGALGIFHPKPKGKGQLIEIKASLYDRVGLMEKAQKMEELIKAHGGNKQMVLLEYNEWLAQLREERKNMPPVFALKTLAHEIGHAKDFEPLEAVRGRGNIFAHVGSLMSYVNKSFPKKPGTDEGLDPEIRKELRGEAEKRARRELGRKAGKEAVAERTTEVYAELIEERMAAEGLATYDEIIGELEKMICWWHGTDTVPKHYASSPEEMYAEAMSVFLNNPAACQKRAPAFYSMLFAYMSRKPEFKAQYQKVMDLIKSGPGLYEERDQLFKESLRQANKDVRAWEDFRKARTWRERKDLIRRQIDREMGPLEQRVVLLKDKKAARKEANAAAMRELGPEADPDKLKARSEELYQEAMSEREDLMWGALGGLDRYLYRQTMMWGASERMNNATLRPLFKAGLGVEDLDIYLFHHRVVEDTPAAGDVAYSEGFERKSSAEQLAWMKERQPANYAMFEQAQEAMRRVYQEEALDRLRHYGVFNQAMLDEFDRRTAYATLNISRKGAPKETTDPLRELFDDQYGKGITSHIYTQLGTHKPTASLYMATMTKMERLINLAERSNMIKKTLAALRSEHSAFKNEWEEAKTQWNGKTQEIKVVNTDRVGTITYFDQGKLVGFYGPKALVDALSYAEVNEIGMIANIFMGAVQLQKDLFTKLNPNFIPRAWHRDIRQFNIQMPGVWKDWLNYVPLTGGAYSRFARPAMEAATSIYMNQPNAIGQEAMRRGVIMPKNVGYMASRAISDETGLVELPDFNDKGAVKRFLIKTGQAGQILEATSKINGMMYMDWAFPDMREEKKLIAVHTWAGSPNFLARMGAARIAELFRLFPGPWKEGWRSTSWAWAGGGGWESRWWEQAINLTRRSLIPALGLYMTFGGGFRRLLEAFGLKGWGPMADAEQQYADGTSEYDKVRNMCIPVGWYDKAGHKAWIFTPPLGESERNMLLALKLAVQTTLNKFSGDKVEAARLQEMAQFMAGDLPGANPVADMIKDFCLYFAGGTPYDSFRQRPAMTPTQREIGGATALKAMAWYSANKFASSLVGTIGPETLDQPKRTTLESVVYRTPILRGYIKISDAGYRDRLRRAAKPWVKAAAEIREEQEQMLIKLRRRGLLNMEGLRRGLTEQEFVKLQDGAQIDAQYPRTTLEPDIELRRYYYTHFKELLASSGVRDLPAGAQMIIRQPSRVTRAAVMMEMLKTAPPARR
jgi:hypothetical protein